MKTRSKATLTLRAMLARRMQYTKGLGLSQQAFCNAKMAFVYTDALLAT
jgi:hypothetical protein